MTRAIHVHLDPGKLRFTATLERHFPQIRDEYLSLPDDEYIPWFEPGAYNHGWWITGFFSLEYSDKEEWFRRVRARCPVTWRVLQEIEGLHLASFSALDPGAIVYPHADQDSGTIRVHLPLVIPEGCEMWIDGQVHRWQEGRCFVFDNRLTHAAHNPTQRRRGLLLFNVFRDIHGVEDEFPDRPSLRFTDRPT